MISIHRRDAEHAEIAQRVKAHSLNAKTLRHIPSLSTTTLKLISNPTLHPPNVMRDLINMGGHVNSSLRHLGALRVSAVRLA